MKKGLDSRLNRALVLALGVGLLVLADRLAWQWMSAEVAVVIAGAVLSMVGGRGLVLRRDDEAQAALSNPPLTMGELAVVNEMRARARKAGKIVGGILALCLLTGCPSPALQTCPGPVVGEASRDVATGVPMYALRCGASVLWRGVCGLPEARGEFLFCDGKPAYRLTGGPIEVTP